jgi:DNA-binding transcriptional MerR regulator
MKLFYSISEVAQMLKVNTSLLRFWEKEFEPLIRPRKNAKGTRFYKEEDIETLKTIHYLVKTQGLTLPGAKKKLLENKSTVKREQNIHTRLMAIREELVALRKSLTLPSDIEEEEENTAAESPRLFPENPNILP